MFHFSAVPEIVQRPADTHVSTGSNAIFECGVRGNPKPTIFWSLKNNDTVLFPKESWNEFHAEDTKDSVSTLVVYVSDERQMHAERLEESVFVFMFFIRRLLITFVFFF